MGKYAQSIDKKVINRILGHGSGWVFTPANFSDLGSRDAVASALRRYRQSGLIRHLARGLYDYPRTEPELGMLTPSPDSVARALAGRDAVRLQPSGALSSGTFPTDPHEDRLPYRWSLQDSTDWEKTDHPEADNAKEHGNSRKNKWIGHPSPAVLGPKACS